MIKHRGLYALLTALLLISTAWPAPPGPPPAAAEKAGSVSALLPVANIVRGPANQPVSTAAKKGDDVVWNDVVRTEKGGRARITLVDQSILSVGSQAELRIIKHDAQSQQTQLEVGYGRVRADVAPVTKQGGSFEVKTPTAVAGVIGTVFGIDSAIGITTFLCLSGTVMISSIDPSITGKTPCPAGTAAVVSANKPVQTRPATQQEIQQFLQSTEPALIATANPSSIVAGPAKINAEISISGAQLGGVNKVTSSAPAVTPSLESGGTATSAKVQVQVAAKATPGPVTLTFSRPSGAPSAAVLSILAPPSVQGAAGGDFKKPFLDTIEQERQAAVAALSGGGQGVSQAADQAYNQISTANSALNPPLDISQASNDLKTPVNAQTGAVSNDTNAINQAAQTAVNSFTGIYNTALQALKQRNAAGTPDAQFQTDLTNGFNQVNAAMLAAFSAAQNDVGQQEGVQTAAIQTITNNWLAKIQQAQVAQGAPSIKSLSANAAPPTGGVPVTITGTGFDSSTKVIFGGVAASNVTFISSTQLTAVAPPQNPGTVDLTVVTGGGQSFTLNGGFSFGGPVPAINPQDTSANPGAPLSLDGSRSTDTMAGTSMIYQWTFCGLGFKPPQLNTPLPTSNAPICSPAPGTISGTDSFYNPTVPATPGQYYVRLQVTDNLGVAAVIYSSVLVTQLYDDPLTRTIQFAQAFSTLLSQQVLAFFDPNFPNRVGLDQALQQDFKAYTSMVANFPSPTPVINWANPPTATVTTNFHLVYTLAGSSTSVTQDTESTVIVWTLTSTGPKPGWYITNFRLPNGFQQGFPSGTSQVGSAATASKLGFTSAAQTLTVGACSGVLTVQSQDSLGNPSNVSAAETLSPTGPAGVTFFTDSGCATAVTANNLTIASGANSAGFYLKDTTGGSPKITVTGTGAFVATDANAATQTETVNTPTGPAITITCMDASRNRPCSNPIQLNGPLAGTGTITPNVVGGNPPGGTVTLTLTDGPGITSTTMSSTPNQFPNAPYGTPETVTAAATITSGGVTTGPTTITVTPSNPQPPVSNLLPTVFNFNIGDITLSGPPAGGQTLPPGCSHGLSLTINAISGFDEGSIQWQWSGISAGVSITAGGTSGNVPLTGTTYGPLNFTFMNVDNLSGAVNFLFMATVTNAGHSATKTFLVPFNLVQGACPAAPAQLLAPAFGHSQSINGIWSTGGFGGGMAAVTRQRTVALPDLQLNAGSVSFSPSIPKAGDTVTVRFKLTNSGDADATRVPVALLVDGTAVATDTFDVRAGGSTLAGLEWKATAGAAQAAVVVDPAHTVPQKTAVGKSATLAHFSVGGATPATTGGGVQRSLLEVAEGACLGFRFASGSGSTCGSADVEITIEDLGNARYTLAGQNGIADLGTSSAGANLSSAQYSPQAVAIAGHSYAVRLKGGQIGILQITAIRTPGRAGAKGRQVFRSGKVGRAVGADNNGVVEPGDVSGSQPRNQSKVIFDVSYRVQ